MAAIDKDLTQQPGEILAVFMLPKGTQVLLSVCIALCTGCYKIKSIMNTIKEPHKSISYFIRTLSIVIGLVLIWRGIWHVLDVLEMRFFGGELFWTGIGGIVIGVLLLYIPDHNLKEIEKL